MTATNNIQNQHRKVEALHLELQGWKSDLHFIEDEMLFIEHLLDSYVFQPNTKNLFERLQDYQRRLEQLKGGKKKMQKLLLQHENKLGGMMECADEYCDLPYYRKHDALKANVIDFTASFRELKSEIFNYAGGILKKRKPTEEP